MSGTLEPSVSGNPHLVGHAPVEAAFTRLLEADRLPHAWMLQGTRGTGKATLAFRMARRALASREKRAHCEDPNAALFRMVAHESHPDLHVLRREIDPRRKKRRNEIGVDQVRAVGEDLRKTSALGGARVLIVDAADELTAEAANGLLKLLEEPPDGVLIILVVQRPGRLPATIASRCARLWLRPLDAEEVATTLRLVDPSLDDATLASLVAIADGSPGQALERHREGWFDTYRRVLEALAGVSGSAASRLEAADLLSALFRDHGAAFLVGLLGTALRRLLYHPLGAPCGPELFAGEARILRTLGASVGLDQAFAMWDNLAAVQVRLEILNADPCQTFLALIETLRPEPGVGS